MSKGIKKKPHTRADAQPASALPVPTGCIHLTPSTSESARSSIWPFQRSTANQDNVEAIRHICVLMAPFSLPPANRQPHHLCTCTLLMHETPQQLLLSQCGNFRVLRSLETSVSRTCGCIIFQPAEGDVLTRSQPRGCGFTPRSSANTFSLFALIFQCSAAVRMPHTHLGW